MYTTFRCSNRWKAAFLLPCLNHACDSNVAVMADLFGGAAAKVVPSGIAVP